MTDWLRKLDDLQEDQEISESAPTALTKPTKPPTHRKCCFWYYKLNDSCAGFTQMGLMTDSPAEAQRQLSRIYGHPVRLLNLKGALK